VNYKDFFDPDEVETFKRVKGGSMRLARVGRTIAAEMVGGTLPKGRVDRTTSAKEYVRTSQGVFRLAMSHQSDNKTEMREHDRLGAKVVVMGDDVLMGGFFAMHGLLAGVALAEFKRRIRNELHGAKPEPIPPTIPGQTEIPCPVKFEFGGIACVRPAGHSGPHSGPYPGLWFNNEGKRIEGGSAEDVGY
jgi:hypothetical protein